MLRHLTICLDQNTFQNTFKSIRMASYFWLVVKLKVYMT